MAEGHPAENQTETTDEATITVAAKKGRKPNVTVLVNPEDFARQQVGGFINFLREHAIVGLAVGFVVATQVQGVIKQLIASFLDPLSTLLFGNSLSSDTFTLRFHGRSASFSWGLFVYTLIDFLFVVLAIYIIIKVFNLDKLDKASK